MDNVIELDNYRDIHELVKRRVGDKFVLSFLDDDGNCYSYVSPDLSDMETCFIADTINSIRNKE